ncbi:unnamed protein product [[Candida] boidinii]|uniref:Unnamed protein product n=1 Tax=Candida boidinii TaxID=5477 RepID=A0A9W6WDN9_CANBO|nr:hypothetical protein B5S30_g2766 [[Candida] boidinii]GME67282.1 unnamed protein product [[Candida] boidinii]
MASVVVKREQLDVKLTDSSPQGNKQQQKQQQHHSHEIVKLEKIDIKSEEPSDKVKIKEEYQKDNKKTSDLQESLIQDNIFLQKQLNINSLQQVTKPIIKRRRKPKLKYRPPNGTVLNLNDIDLVEDLNVQDESNRHIRLNDLSFLHHAFKHSQKMVVVMGAGVSVASGIPDFRSSNGLFHNMSSSSSSSSSTKGSGKQLFDYNLFRSKELISKFHNMIKNLYSMSLNCKPTNFHHYLDAISQDDRLLRLYTQNIDCLESQLPNLQTITPLNANTVSSINTNSKIKNYPTTIQVHGNVQLLSCSKCQFITEMDPKYFDNLTHTDEVHPSCPECTDLNYVREIAGKRKQVVGILRPRIVLYNEFHPDGEIIGEISTFDLKKRPDCLIVVGTTLKIPGIRRLVKEMARVVHSNNGYVIWINIDEPSMSIVDYVEFFDLIVVGDCQKIPDLVNKYENEILNKPKAKKPTKSQKKPAKSSPKAASTTSAKSTSKSPKSSSKIAKSVKSAKSSTLASSRSPVSSMKKKAELDIKLPAKKRKLIPKK